METTYRFRFLIYLAAFMLIMSVCFAYAEPSHPLLFQVAPQHSGFLSPSAEQPAFDPAALRSAAPVVQPQQLEMLENAAHGGFSLHHRARRAHRSMLNTMPAPSEGQSLASWLGMTAKPDAAR